MIDKSIFKSYDIRGIYPDQLSDESVKKIGQVFVEYTHAKKVVVGQDMRISSPKIFACLAQGIAERGADVINIGQVPVDAVYFAVGRYHYRGGIMITASHNPKEYNGLKMVKEGVFVIRGEEILRHFEQKNTTKIRNRPKGRVIKKDIWSDYLKHVLSFIEAAKIKPFKVVIDASNAMAGIAIPKLKDKLPIQIIPINFKLNGKNPAHSFNPLEKRSLEKISKTIRKFRADMGFIFDGDGDRIFLLDEKSNLVRSDISLLLLAKCFLKKNPGARIVYNIICSRAVPELIKKFQGKPVRSAVGFVNIKENLIKHKALMGGEFSGHFSFRDNFNSDSGIIAFLILLEIISKDGRKVSEIVKELNIYSASGEINFPIKDKNRIISRIKQKYSDGQQDFLDGLTVEYPDWKFNLRPSNTEPVLRLNVEVKDKKSLDEKVKELTLLIQK